MGTLNLVISVKVHAGQGMHIGEAHSKRLMSTTARQCSTCSTGTGSYTHTAVQDVKALIQRVFRLQTEISRLKADVQKIGSARDTQELRQKVGQAGQRLKGDAQQINHDLQQAHKAKKTQQTTKIVADFEVPHPMTCLFTVRL